MKDFLEHINSLDIDQLKSELAELYTSYDLVKNYYQIKLKNGGIDERILEKYKDQISEAIYPNKYNQGGLDVEKVNAIIQQLNSDATLKYYIEVSLHSIEECTSIANEYGGDFGDEFYIYFEELYEKIVELIVKKSFQEEYKIRLKEIADFACEGYGHYDQLQDVYKEYIKE